MGDVIVCCHDYHNTIKFGNVKKEKLMDIWNKQGYRELRRELRKGIQRYDLCKNCVYMIGASGSAVQAAK
jgi:radical SAM protein with 4Fe4S-binding SPASM domain